MTPAREHPVAAAVASVVRTTRFRYAHEEDLQAGLAAALTATGLHVEREVALDDGRVDLLVNGTVGIEVKVAGRGPAALSQLYRYARSDRIHALVAVTTRATHRFPAEVAGKPLTVINLAGAGL